jgi:hypothetical protein
MAARRFPAGPVAEFPVSTVNAEGREVVPGYAHARLAS